MLQVEKRSGKVEPFDMNKIRTSLETAGDEVGAPLNASDLDGIAGEMKALLEGREKVASQQLYVMLAGILYTRDLMRVVESYTKHQGNAWKGGRK